MIPRGTPSKILKLPPEGRAKDFRVNLPWAEWKPLHDRAVRENLSVAELIRRMIREALRCPAA